MKPRVFVSSTYYDLKHIRSYLERFIKQYGFEPILFESGNILFEHDEELDKSCYKEVRRCQMMILIIGGRYGSPSTEGNREDFKKQYENQYISITKSEFKEAVQNNIPIFIFIDKNVNAEYETFKKNKSFFIDIQSDPKNEFKFAHVDSINVFEFIDEIKSKPICTFEKYDEIENYLINQWAGMFYNYLSDLREEKNNSSMLDSVLELRNVTDRINDMLNEVGRSVIKNDEKYLAIINKQNEKSMKFYANQIVKKIDFNQNFLFLNEEECFSISKTIIEKIIKNPKLSKHEKNDGFDSFLSELDIIDDLNKELDSISKGLAIEKIDLLGIVTIYNKSIKPIINNSKNDLLDTLFEQQLEVCITNEFNPF